MAAARPALIWRPPLWAAAPASGIMQSAAIAVANPSFLLAENSAFALDIVVAPVMTRMRCRYARDAPACARIHGCHGDVLNGRQKVPARQLAPSPCDHAQEDAIPAHEVMI